MGRYVALIEYLVQAGLVVYGSDHRGHSRTALSPNTLEISDRVALTCL